MKTPADILAEMATTYRERNAMYCDNYKLVGPVMMALFPEGVALRTAEQITLWHLFELIVVKMTRFGVSNLTHVDSIHDIAIYAAMIEGLLQERKEKSK